MIKYFLRNEEFKFERKSTEASGYDLVADIPDGPLILHPGERMFIPTGLYLQMTYGVEAQIRPRSGLAAKFGVTVINTPGTVDSDYRGELIVTLVNLDWKIPYTVNHGDRIAQLVFAPVFNGAKNIHLLPGSEPIRVKSLEDLDITERGIGGHGSTGR